ncbi:hypothetical protein IGI71_001153 [Enterococcus sp. DIV1279b]|uniref:acetyltransferase n=1 Tax=Enterococcus sp. DIV1279b TaxID=2774663 RepID=UPI003D3007A4
MKNSYILIGAGGNAKVVREILLNEGKEIKGYFDDEKKRFYNLKYLGNISDILSMTDDFLSQHYFIITIGDNLQRKSIKQILSKRKISYGRAVDPKAIISSTAEIGNGSVIMANAIINADSRIGEFCIINTGVIIEHDCKVNNFVHVSPGVKIAGNVIVDEDTHIGIGATIIQGINIGYGATVGAGSVVIRDVPNKSIVYGVPAQVKERRSNID